MIRNVMVPTATIHAKIVDIRPQSDFACEDIKSPSYILNKPNFILSVNGKVPENGNIQINAEDIQIGEILEAMNLLADDIDKIFTEVE